MRGGRTGDAADLAGADLVVDGIVGLSARGALRPDAAELVGQVRAPVVAVDVPSGVDPDTGAVDGPVVRARGDRHVRGVQAGAPAGAGVGVGRVELVALPFALPPARTGALRAAEVGALWPVPGPTDDKYTQGVTGVVAGSAVFPGAAVLCTGAAVAATSGMVRYAGTGRAAVLAAYPEVVGTDDVTDAGRVQAWAWGRAWAPTTTRSGCCAMCWARTCRAAGRRRAHGAG